MKGKKINSPVILITPMDWGLGHATRCIPIITNLLDQKCEVIIAASGPGRILLQAEFPGLLCLDLKGYDIHYSRRGWWLPFALFAQLPKIISTIYAEHKWLKKAVKRFSIDAVISDNRMGMFHRHISAIYITHQLNIKTGNGLTEWLARKVHYWFINKFNECWVPDSDGEINLAGELSHPSAMPGVPVKYIGALSRFEKYPAEKKYDIAVILSGPEPQRTIFEELIIKGIGDCNRKVILIRGNMDAASLIKVNFPSLEIHEYLGATDLNRVMLESDLIISRCGYSGIMDLVKLQKKAILVPTPGQTEQEYLAEYLSGKKIFCCIAQEQFSLPAALKTAADFPFTNIAVEQNDYEGAINKFLDSLRLHQQ